MSNELLDFTARDNFDFFTYSRSAELTQEDKNRFKVDCQRVLEYAHATVRDMCLLGLRLSELKRSKAWEDVINPKSGYIFWNHSFEEFCDYAFGFSKTKTSDLMRISQFVTLSGDNVDFIDKRFSKYNTSQLVELAAVAPSNRIYFHSGMSVSDMRKAKNYMKMGTFFEDKHKKDFDLMKEASAWKESEDAKKEIKASSEVLPGQISFEEAEMPSEEEKNPTSDLATYGGEVEEQEETEETEALSEEVQEEESENYIERARRIAHEQGIPFYEGDAEEFNPYVYDGKMSVEDYRLMHKMREEDKKAQEEAEEKNPTSDLATYGGKAEAEAEETSEASRHDFTCRRAIREFLNNYKAWVYIPLYFLGMYRCIFRNGMMIYAVETDVRGDMENGEPSKIVRYYWQMKDGQAFEASKDILWKYMLEHRDEL